MRRAPALVLALISLIGCPGGSGGKSDDTPAATRSPDLSAGFTLRFVSGGGEAGAPYTEVIVQSDGTVTLTDAGTTDFETNVYPRTVRELKLDATGLRSLLADLERAGFWALEQSEGIGADMETHYAETVIGGEKQGVSCPMSAELPSDWAAVNARFRALSAEVQAKGSAPAK